MESVSLHRLLSPSGSDVAVSSKKTGQRGERTKRAIGGRCVSEKQFGGLQPGDDLERIPLGLFYNVTRNLTEIEALITRRGTLPSLQVHVRFGDYNMQMQEIQLSKTCFQA